MLSFPPNTLLENAIRIPIIFAEAGIVAFAKPAGTPDFSNALRKQIAEKKPSALALNLAQPQFVCGAEDEISGTVIFADKATGTLERWRNALGSVQLSFRYIFLAQPPEPDDETEFLCDLPVAQHFSEPRALISHKTGKKSATIFRRLEKLGTRELWQAETTFPRPHQIRLHAAECGLPIVGETLYANVPAVQISELRPKKRLNKGEDKAFYTPLCLHLEKIVPLAGTLFAGTPAREIVAPLPASLETLLRKLRNKLSG